MKNRLIHYFKNISDVKTCKINGNQQLFMKNE